MKRERRCIQGSESDDPSRARARGLKSPCMGHPIQASSARHGTVTTLLLLAKPSPFGESWLKLTILLHFYHRSNRSSKYPNIIAWEWWFSQGKSAFSQESIHMSVHDPRPVGWGLSHLAHAAESRRRTCSIRLTARGKIVWFRAASAVQASCESTCCQGVLLTTRATPHEIQPE